MPDRFFANPAALPAMPELATRLLRSLSRDDLSLTELAELVGRDASLAAKLLRLANSARFSPSRPVAGLREAAQLIGLRQLRELTMTACLAGAFPTAKGFDRVRFWRHALAIAGHARVLAGLAGLDAEAAYVAGLVLRVGHLLMLLAEPQLAAHAIERAEAPDTLMAHERALLGCAHPGVSAGLARRWHFPPQVADALAAAEDPAAAQPFSPLGAVLRLASALADAGDLGLPELPTMLGLHAPLAARLGLNSDRLGAELLPFDALVVGADQLLA